MTAARSVAAIATDLTCRAAGRRTVVRTARYVLSRARLDYPNDLSTNGESALQRWILRFSQAGEQIHMADVGANVGRWSESMLAVASKTGRERDLRLHAFEPDSRAFARLAETLDGRSANLSKTALSDREGSSPFYIVAPGAGTNSLYPVSEANPVTQEQVVTITLDSYAEQSGVARFALVKIDAEGHDLAVLRGARTLLAEHRIAVAQFEYNHRWILGRFYLRDAFEFLLALGYRVGKLTPRGVEFYPGWDADLETFVEGNYLACDPEVASELPAVRWWKSE
jgi:FkbM family methyltransferase